MITDLRSAVRLFRMQPFFAAVVIAVLALGIGANTAIFTVVNAVLLKPLAYRDPARLVVALHDGAAPVSPADYFDYQKGTRGAFESMGAAQAWGANLNAGERPEAVPGLKLTSEILPLLGVAPQLGRMFRSDEQHAGRDHVVILSEGLWKRRFGGDRSVVGRRVLLDGISYEIVGVMPEGFRFAPFWMTRAQMWSPLNLDGRVSDRDGRSLRVFARLRPGVTVAQAQSQMDAVARRLEQLYPATNAKLAIHVTPLREMVVGAVRPTLLILFAAVGLVLLIACANAANLMLTQATARRREFAVRAALGASRVRVMRTLLLETLLLALAGAVAGAFLGSWSLEAVGGLLPAGSLPRQYEVMFDSGSLLFTACAALAAVFLAGAVPAWQAGRVDLTDSLKESGRGSSEGSGTLRTRSLLIAGEVALSLTLLTGAGLMARSLLKLNSVDPGFRAEGLLTMQVSLGGTNFDADGRRLPMFESVRARLAELPGVQSVSAINHLPVAGDLWRLGYRIEGRRPLPPGASQGAVYRVVLPGYFATMGIGRVRGRDFDARDRTHSAGVAVINETMAKRRWPGSDPVGQHIRFGLNQVAGGAPLTVIGVVKDARQGDWTGVPDDEIYMPYLQQPDAMGLSYLTFVLRTKGDPEQAIGEAQRAVAEVAPELTTAEAQTMTRVVAATLWRARLASLLLAAFAALALCLASIGIYGVLAYSLGRRTREIGVRLALGAHRHDVVRMVVGQGLVPVALGLVVGLLGSVALAQLMGSLLYGVTARDPITFVAVTLILLVVAVVANLVPALRATRIDPVTALRYE